MKHVYCLVRGCDKSCTLAVNGGEFVNLKS